MLSPGPVSDALADRRRSHQGQRLKGWYRRLPRTRFAAFDLWLHGRMLVVLDSHVHLGFFEALGALSPWKSKRQFGWEYFPRLTMVRLNQLLGDVRAQKPSSPAAAAMRSRLSAQDLARLPRKFQAAVLPSASVALLHPQLVRCAMITDPPPSSQGSLSLCFKLVVQTEPALDAKETYFRWQTAAAARTYEPDLENPIAEPTFPYRVALAATPLAPKTSPNSPPLEQGVRCFGLESDVWQNLHARTSAYWRRVVAPSGGSRRQPWRRASSHVVQRDGQTRYGHHCQALRRASLWLLPLCLEAVRNACPWGRFVFVATAQIVQVSLPLPSAANLEASPPTKKRTLSPPPAPSAAKRPRPSTAASQDG